MQENMDGALLKNEEGGRAVSRKSPVRRYWNHERVPIARERHGTIVAASRSARLWKERDAFNEKQMWREIPDGPLILSLMQL